MKSVWMLIGILFLSVGVMAGSVTTKNGDLLVDGKIGVGKTPSSELDVEGTVKAKSIDATTGILTPLMNVTNNLDATRISVYDYIASPRICLNMDCRTSWPSGGGGGVQGSGTPRFIPMWSSSNSLSNSIIQLGPPEQTNTVYIAPNQTSSLSLGYKVNLFANQGTQGNSSINVEGPGNPSAFASLSSGTSFSYLGLKSPNETGFSVFLQSNRNYPSYMDSNFGIKTHNPLAALDVNGEARISGIANDGVGKVVCIKSDGALGTCSNAPASNGTCNCS